MTGSGDNSELSGFVLQFDQANHVGLTAISSVSDGERGLILNRVKISMSNCVSYNTEETYSVYLT